MRREDVEAMLQELSGTTRYLQDTGRLLRDAMERIAAMNAHVQEVASRIENAIVTGQNALQDDAEEGSEP